MKKLISILYILVFSIFFTGCKNPVLDFEWDIFEGEGSYSAASDQSSFKLNFRIKINQSTVNINPTYPSDTREFQHAAITYWECMLVAGDAGVMLFNGDTVNERFGNIYINVSNDEQIEYLWVFIESQTLIDNDVYRGMNPDKIILFVEIMDSEGIYKTMEKEVDFNFTRE